MHMRQFELTRNEMRVLSPELVRAHDMDRSADVSYFLAVAILPGCEAIPMHVEADPEAIRHWMSQSLLMQARGHVGGRPVRTRTIRGRVPVPGVVASLVHLLADDEAAMDPDPATLTPRLAARWADPDRDPPPPAPEPPAPSPFAPRPFR
jgi:hypothetical protein